VLCVKCKGRLYCGKSSCPILDSFYSRSYQIREMDERPTPPSVFVGRTGYPKIYAGPMLVLGDQNPEIYENPSAFSSSVEEVLSLRMGLARTYRIFTVESAKNPDRNLSALQEIASSIRFVDVEGEYDRIIRKPSLDDITMPSGISAVFRKVRIVSNPKIPQKVEKVSEDEIRAVDGVMNLYISGFSTSYIQRVFSVGMLGMERKLVPTRWSITAVHDIIAETLKKEIVNFDSINEVLLFSYQHYGNHFEVILYPSSYSFQLVEIWIEKSLWSPERTWIGSDRETAGRKKEYSDLSGGYYAARLPVVEHLHRMRRQAGVIVLREILPEYTAPLGVWVVEEGVRKAMNSKPERFHSLDDALNTAERRIKTRRDRWEKHIQLYQQMSLKQFL